jgi:hypothetical protein
MTSSSFTTHHAALPATSSGFGDRRRTGSRQLRLLPSGDGWTLVSLDGECVYSALGFSGRRRCLEHARAAGVIALI